MPSDLPGGTTGNAAEQTDQTSRREREIRKRETRAEEIDRQERETSRRERPAGEREKQQTNGKP